MSTASVSGRLRAERRAASGLPLLNDYRADGWREKLMADFGIAMPPKATKTELYIAWRKAQTERS